MKKSVISILSILAGIISGTGIAIKMAGDSIQKAKRKSDKYLALFLMMNQWVKVKQEGKKVTSYFEKRQYRKIAVYGMSYAGETLINELKDSDIVVAYGIDKRADTIYAEVDIVSVEDELEAVDVVVVTAVTFFDEIEKKLSIKMECPIVSLEDILYEI